MKLGISKTLINEGPALPSKEEVVEIFSCLCGDQSISFVCKLFYSVIGVLPLQGKACKNV